MKIELCIECAGEIHEENRTPVKEVCRDCLEAVNREAIRIGAWDNHYTGLEAG